MLLKRKQDSEAAQTVRENTQKSTANGKINTIMNLWIEFKASKTMLLFSNLTMQVTLLELKGQNHKAGYKSQS